jgi:hydrogenase nickel incorporation protein HypA/HybF
MGGWRFYAHNLRPKWVDIHELSIALSIVDAVETALSAETNVTVETVHIQVGTLTGIVPEALAFSWEVATFESRLRGSQLSIETVPVRGLCPTCAVEQEISSLQSFRCPVCQASITQITGGNELEIVSVEVQDAAQNAAQEKGV